MSNLYVGAEVDSHWSEIKLDPGTFEIVDTSSGDAATADPVTNASAELAYSAGVSGRVGYYTSPSTLISLNAGLVGSQFDVSWDNQAEEYWDIGMRYGIGMESTLFDGIGVRISWSVTDYYDASVYSHGSIDQTSGTGVDVEIQPTMSVAHVGLLYTF
jgi:opacity protein-like surface antigen